MCKLLTATSGDCERADRSKFLADSLKCLSGENFMVCWYSTRVGAAFTFIFPIEWRSFTLCELCAPHRRPGWQLSMSVLNSTRAGSSTY